MNHQNNEVTVEEAAKILGVSTNTIRKWISDGKLPARRVGERIIRIKRESLDAMVTDVEPKNK